MGESELVEQLLMLARYLRALGSLSHLVHLNYIGDGNFLAVHHYLKERYEVHLEEFDTAAEFVRALGAPFLETVQALHELPPGFRDLEPGCSCSDGLAVYHGNLQQVIALAQVLEPVAQKARAIDVANWCAELVASSSKACWFLRATLGCRP